MLKEVIGKNDQGIIIRKAGVMGVVLVGGQVKPNDIIRIELPDKRYKSLECIW